MRCAERAVSLVIKGTDPVSKWRIFSILHANPLKNFPALICGFRFEKPICIVLSQIVAIIHEIGEVKSDHYP